MPYRNFCRSRELKVGESANGTKVTVAVGQTVEVSLPGNVTTGYDWSLDPTTHGVPSLIATVAESYASTSPAGVVGAGGVRTFVYRAVSPGTATLQLYYTRAWQTGVPPAKTFSLTIVVQ